MRSSIMRFVVIVGLLSLSATVAMAKTAGSTSPTYVVELTASAPSFPDLPQEDDFLCGDVTGDGLVNVLDIISLVSYIMGGSPSPFDLNAADITADDNINVLDIIAMVNIIMQVPGQPCGCVAPVLYEGQTYTMVQIGGQCWFKENLNVGTMIEGNQGSSNNGIIEKYCYSDDEANCGTYGGLYAWNEAMQYLTTDGVQGICPLGWHFPTDGEWTILQDFLGGATIAGGSLKEAGTTHWDLPNTGATNSSGFTALPGGECSSSGSFQYLHSRGNYWTSSQQSSTNGLLRYLTSISASVFPSYTNKVKGLSVRCIKGCWPMPTPANAGPDQLDLPGTATTLAGNTPTIGTGMWEIVSGTGGMLVSPSSPASIFQGLEESEYTLSWTITNECESSVDEVVISFASDMSQPCPGIPSVIYEDQTYNTVLIGDQCWLKQNLNVGTMLQGDQGSSNNGIIEKYCYGNDESNCDTYGALYTWREAMQYVTTAGVQGICPLGWHFPTDGEWTILQDFLGEATIAGGNLKEAGPIHWDPPNTGATNSSGFTGLPGGDRKNTGGFEYLHSRGYFWTSSQQSSTNGWLRYLTSISASVFRDYTNKDKGLSVRCLKDN